MEKLSSLVVILVVNMAPHCGQYLLQLHLPLSGRWHRLRNLFVRTSVLVTLADNVALSRSGALNVHLLRFRSCLHMLLLPQVCSCTEAAVSGAWVAALSSMDCNSFGIFGSTTRWLFATATATGHRATVVPLWGSYQQIVYIYIYVCVWVYVCILYTLLYSAFLI